MSLRAALAAVLLSTVLPVEAASERAGENGMIRNQWHELTPGVSTPQDVRARLGSPTREVAGVSRGGVSNLLMFDYSSPPCSIFFADDRILVIVIVPHEVMGFPRIERDWTDALGAPERKLPSRRGKNYWIYLYANRGIAVTMYAERVEAIELFEPMIPGEYESRLYLRPPLFVK